jgi:hypothetical protein
MNKNSIIVYHISISQGTSFLLQQKDRIVFVVQEYKLLKSKFREEAS